MAWSGRHSQGHQPGPQPLGPQRPRRDHRGGNPPGSKLRGYPRPATASGSGRLNSSPPSQPADGQAEMEVFWGGLGYVADPGPDLPPRKCPYNPFWPDDRAFGLLPEGHYRMKTPARRGAFLNGGRCSSADRCAGVGGAINWSGAIYRPASTPFSNAKVAPQAICSGAIRRTFCE